MSSMFNPQETLYSDYRSGTMFHSQYPQNAPGLSCGSALSNGLSISQGMTIGGMTSEQGQGYVYTDRANMSQSDDFGLADVLVPPLLHFLDSTSPANTDSDCLPSFFDDLPGFSGDELLSYQPHPYAATTFPSGSHLITTSTFHRSGHLTKAAVTEDGLNHTNGWYLQLKDQSIDTEITNKRAYLINDVMVGTSRNRMVDASSDSWVGSTSDGAVVTSSDSSVTTSNDRISGTRKCHMTRSKSDEPTGKKKKNVKPNRKSKTAPPGTNPGLIPDESSSLTSTCVIRMTPIANDRKGHQTQVPAESKTPSSSSTESAYISPHTIWPQTIKATDTQITNSGGQDDSFIQANPGVISSSVSPPNQNGPFGSAERGYSTHSQARPLPYTPSLPPSPCFQSLHNGIDAYPHQSMSTPMNHHSPAQHFLRPLHNVLPINHKTGKHLPTIRPAPPVPAEHHGARGTQVTPVEVRSRDHWTVGSNKCRLTLNDGELWAAFHEKTNEMIVTKQGRKIFPTLSYSVSGLDPVKTYSIYLEVCQVDEFHWNFKEGEWRSCKNMIQRKEESKQRVDKRLQHHISPKTGAYWMTEGIKFSKLKLTNHHLDNNQVFVTTMKRYVPKIYIEEEGGGTIIAHSFTETQFIAVTAYQNTDVIDLKIKHNPFAKGAAGRNSSSQQFTQDMFQPSCNAQDTAAQMTLHSYGPLATYNGCVRPRQTDHNFVMSYQPHQSLEGALYFSHGDHRESKPHMMLPSSFPMTIGHLQSYCGPHQPTNHTSTPPQFQQEVVVQANGQCSSGAVTNPSALPGQPHHNCGPAYIPNSFSYQSPSYMPCQDPAAQVYVHVSQQSAINQTAQIGYHRPQLTHFPVHNDVIVLSSTSREISNIQFDDSNFRKRKRTDDDE